MDGGLRMAVALLRQLSFPCFSSKIKRIAVALLRHPLYPQCKSIKTKPDDFISSGLLIFNLFTNSSELDLLIR